MPEPISSFSRRDLFLTGYAPERESDVDASDQGRDKMAEDPSFTRVGSGIEETTSGAPLVGVFKPTAGQLQYLPPAVVKLLQPVFDRLAESNRGHRLDVSAVPFIVKDIGAAKGQTVRGVVYVSPSELERPLANQLYLIGHELTHALQFELIGPAGADADERWSLMLERYAAEARGPGRASQYDVPDDLRLAGLNVVDARFTLESIASRVGREGSGRVYDR